MIFRHHLFVVAAGLFGTTPAFAQDANLFLHATDDASITVSKTALEDGSFAYDFWANTPELLDINYIYCKPHSCTFELTLKTQGPVDMTGFNIHQFTPYGYSTVTSPDISIDLTLFDQTEILLSEAYTYPSLDPNKHADFVPVSAGNASTSVTGTHGPYVTIRGFFELFDLLPETTTQYQTFQIVGSGVQWSPLELYRDFHTTHAGNKGERELTVNPYRGYEFEVKDWNKGTGHYTALSVLTFGDSSTDKGRDLSGYNTLEATLSCLDSMVIEAFIGYKVYDSDQQFLDDITCDGSINTYTWDISHVNKKNIQTGLWLHIPVWKNEHLSQQESLKINLKNLYFKQ